MTPQDLGKLQTRKMKALKKDIVKKKKKTPVSKKSSAEDTTASTAMEVD